MIQLPASLRRQMTDGNDDDDVDDEASNRWSVGLNVRTYRQWSSHIVAPFSPFVTFEIYCGVGLCLCLLLIIWSQRAINISTRALPLCERVYSGWSLKIEMKRRRRRCRRTNKSVAIAGIASGKINLRRTRELDFASS